jgi:hypothetical protein
VVVQDYVADFGKMEGDGKRQMREESENIARFKKGLIAAAVSSRRGEEVPQWCKMSGFLKK